MEKYRLSEIFIQGVKIPENHCLPHVKLISRVGISSDICMFSPQGK